MNLLSKVQYNKMANIIVYTVSKLAGDLWASLTTGADTLGKTCSWSRGWIWWLTSNGQNTVEAIRVCFHDQVIKRLRLCLGVPLSYTLNRPAVMMWVALGNGPASGPQPLRSLNLEQVFPRRAFRWDHRPCQHLAYSLAHSLDCDMACPRWAWLAHRRLYSWLPGLQKFVR